MKQNPNRIIKAVALALAISCVLCACNKVKTDDPQPSAPPSSSHTTEAATQELTTAQATTTQPTTEKTTATEPATTRPEPVQTTTEKETQTTNAPLETTTRHKNSFANAFITSDKIIGYRLISTEEIEKVAGELADDSEIYYVRLEDGTKTYYMAVDLQTAQAIALSNPQVLRELCRQLDSKQQLMAEEEGDEEYILMDYTHLVGELEMHYLGYLLTGALGAEDGPLSSFYNSCKIADLNIDENRFGPAIDIIGAIYG